MKPIPFTDDISAYLKEDDIIDYRNVIIAQLAEELYKKTDSETAYIKAAYEYVRDNVSHSADINEDVITCTASEVLKAGHGICFAKSHLLAALLRFKGIPAGFCYQKISFCIEALTILVYHGLNGVYLNEYKKWIRLDPRGNTGEINAQFSLDKEKFAYNIHEETGEEDGFVIYPDPDVKVLEKLRNNRTRTELWGDLPVELNY